MATITTTTAAALLKRIYSPKQVQYMALKKRPFLGLVKKNTSQFGGAAYAYAIEYGRNPGRSRVFATAQSNVGSTSSAQFLITRKKDYGVARIETEAIMASKGSEAAFMPLLRNTMERTIDGVGFSLSKDIWGNAGGSLGQLSATAAVSTVVTLANKEDAINFYVGQKIDGSATDGTNAAGALLNTLVPTVTAVDHDAGTVTFDVDVSGANYLFAASSYLFQNGDFLTTGSGKIAGIQAWLPATAPTSGTAAFFGVSRHVAPNDLAGLRPDVSAASTIHEKIMIACGSGARLGAEIDHIFMNPEDVTDLTLELEGKVVYNKTTSPQQRELAQVSFDSIKFMTPVGAVDIVADQHCPKSRAYGLDMSTWEFGSLGGAPIVLAEGDDIFVYNDDAKEIRVGYYGNLYCTAPGRNWTISLA